MRRRIVTLALFGLALNLGMQAQQVPTSEILTRVLLIRVGHIEGTGFTAERDGKQYLFTARHMLKSLDPKNAAIEVHVGSEWKRCRGQVILPDRSGIDLAVFTLDEPLTPSLEIELGGRIAVGQEGYFFGYPYGAHGWHSDLRGSYIAFVKRVSLSAIATLPDGLSVFYLDGFNNPGFSGGPVAFYNFQTRKWAVMAVISGFQPESAKKRIGDTFVDTDVLVNSGVIVAYPIQAALDALDKHIGEHSGR
jgi:trypsin-like peptidase